MLNGCHYLCTLVMEKKIFNPLIFFWVLSELAFCQTKSWKEMENSPLSQIKIDDCFFINSNTGWVINVKESLGQIYKTSDGGINWEKQFERNTILRCIGFYDSLLGWVGTLDSNILFETKDGGNTWSSVEKILGPRPKGICGISIVNKNIIYACGKYSGPAYLIKTTNSGFSWLSIDMNSYATSLVDCNFFNSETGFIVGGTGSLNYKEAHSVILFTSDGGITWESKYISNLSEQICWKMSFSSFNTGYVSIQSFSLSDTVSYLKTTDNGLTWNEKRFKSLSNIYECFFRLKTAHYFA